VKNKFPIYGEKKQTINQILRNKEKYSDNNFGVDLTEKRLLNNS